jgi:hypothetical protein
LSDVRGRTRISNIMGCKSFLQERVLIIYGIHESSDWACGSVVSSKWHGVHDGGCLYWIGHDITH